MNDTFKMPVGDVEIEIPNDYMAPDFTKTTFKPNWKNYASYCMKQRWHRLDAETAAMISSMLLELANSEIYNDEDNELP